MFRLMCAVAVLSTYVECFGVTLCIHLLQFCVLECCYVTLLGEFHGVWKESARGVSSMTLPAVRGELQTLQAAEHEILSLEIDRKWSILLSIRW